MIKVKDLVPEIYYSKSRDFQAIGRVFEVLYNYSKTNVDLLRNSDKDIKMLELLTKTLGFNTKHNYNTEDLITLCNVFVTIIRDKGSITSIDEAITALLNAQHIEKNFSVIDAVDEFGNKLFRLDIYVPEELEDRILLEDLFDYILPTGYVYRFINSVFSDVSYGTDFIETNVLNAFSIDYNKSSQVGIVKTVSESVENITEPKIDNNPQQLGLTYTGVVFRPKKISDIV